ncbi:hypothetical protein ACN2CC_35435 (plasmid) [Mesorhizobium muleiense]|uniref:hypothetical protein n=1 Tax=Mesorhizobium muleiense TaxID=1004279 RepID=UPI003AFB072A
MSSLVAEISSDTGSGAEKQVAQRRDAVRILFILDRAGNCVGRDVPEGYVKVIEAEMRIQAIDFWIRNPDYLAHELLDQYELGGRKDATLLDRAGTVMAGDEPELRRLGMLRYLFGAYEALDDAMATLSLHGLAVLKRKYKAAGSAIAQSSFFLTAEGAAKAEELAKVSPLTWYADRASLVAEVAGDRKGGALKKRQYEVAEYHDARYGRLIQPIRAEVARRLAELRLQL